MPLAHETADAGSVGGAFRGTRNIPGGSHYRKPGDTLLSMFVAIILGFLCSSTPFIAVSVLVGAAISLCSSTSDFLHVQGVIGQFDNAL